MVWHAVPVDEFPAKGKSIYQTALKPVVLDIISDSDIEDMNLFTTESFVLKVLNVGPSKPLSKELFCLSLTWLYCPRIMNTLLVLVLENINLFTEDLYLLVVIFNKRFRSDSQERNYFFLSEELPCPCNLSKN